LVTEPRSHTGASDSAVIRLVLYRRLHWLWRLLAWPPVGRGLRLLAWGSFAAWLLFVLLLLVLRYGILPRVGDYKADIERAASRAVGQEVSIGSLEARWRGLNPDLILDDVRVLDAAGEPAFTLARVESVLSWQTLWRLQPTLALLAFDGPVLNVRRDTNGRITVAGIATEGESDPAFGEWLLAQKRIRIRDATIVWEDRLRGAPPLILEDLQLALDNRGRRHRFGVSAAPPAELADRLDIRGEVVGDLGEPLETLAGKVFVQLDYADLAGWRAWVDYPIDLPQGRGALRVWGDLEDGGGALTADLALEEVRLCLGRKLPELDLASLRGRLEGRYKTGEWSVRGRKVELLTRQGVRVTPTDFLVELRHDPESTLINGNASASFLDLGTLAALAAHLPLDARSRELLRQHQPQGRISELRASWGLEGENLRRYSLRAGFAGLGMLPGGYFPGGQGLAGRVDLSEKGGDLIIDADASSLSLPAVFPEPNIAFDSLKLNTHWTVKDQAIDVRLARLAFAGPDASGAAQGQYRFTGDGPGVIDLQATIDRADGRAVWRYMPHAVNADARAWLRRGIVGGRGYDGKLILKGDLRNFPFRDDQGGQFLVTAKAAGARVDYADGWPAIEGIDGEMRFGVGMKVTASKGSILGAQLSAVTAEIPDFESGEEILLVRGVAAGPTSEFLRFIDQSPVAESIDRFTDDMKAKGNGRLDLELDIPLRHALETRMRGQYRFDNNELELLAGLPPLKQVNGQLTLSESSITARDIVGRVFGGPLKVQVRNAAEKVDVLATGTAAIAEVSSHFGWPLVNHLTGSAGWRAEIGIRRRQAEVVVTSDLVGVVSPLPAPLTKSAGDALPLRVERTALEGEREQYRITLGDVGRGTVIRRQEAWESGVLAVGSAEARLPEKGLAIRVAMPQLDADAWRPFLPTAAPAVGSPGEAGLEIALVKLDTPQLNLLGRTYQQVDLALRPHSGGWHIALETDEASGDLLWLSAGEGWLEGRFRRLAIRQAAEGSPATNDSLINSLPGMNLLVDDFRIGDKQLGKLEVKAQNTGGAWRLDRLHLQNPDGALNGQAVWRNSGQHQTDLTFDLTATDAGKLLGRLGYVDAVRRGTAKLAGKLRWNGPLTAIDYPSLSGQMTVAAEKGQFNKLEPGVGKLLGLISLQSLPRRLTLDFRDIFSDGLAFDSIESKLAVDQGIMRTVQPLRIFGPAAQIEMEGVTDLRHETQDLRVVVRPEVGGLAAVGAAALVNPVVGAAALVANAVLQKPLNRLFSYRYHVTGTWSDPLVAKAGQSEEPLPESRPESRPESPQGARK
jgi:uncharacterized protein (TIGR02099 family)